VSAPVVAVALDVDLRDLALVPEWQPGDPIKEVPRRTRPGGLEVDYPGSLDPLLALSDGAQRVASDGRFTTPILNIAGQGFSGVNPPDPVGDVGPNHYIQATNQLNGSRITVHGKNGGVLAGPFTLASIGGTGACATGLGDPIVLYDTLAGRWLLSEFARTGNHLCVYVSRTADPVSGGWWFYDFTTPTFPDYPKYAVWPDAYYVGTNESAPAVYALDRVRMLAGQPATTQRFAVAALPGFAFQMLTPADLDGATGPPAQSPGIFLRHRDSEAHGAPGAADSIQVFEFHVDWTTPANSTFTGPRDVAVAEFDSALCGLSSFSCFPQPGSGTRLDPLREVTMFRVQYRNRGGFESLVSNLVTDVNGSDRGGLRWFELRRAGSAPWTLHMEGTYSPDATHRWMGSAALDQDGNLAIGYSVSDGASVFPGLRFAGRLAGDPAGTLAQGETTLIAGSAANGSNRWGDYSALSVDPADDCTFWFTSLYSPASTWATRIGSFRFDGCGGPPVPDFGITCTPAALTAPPGTSTSTTCAVTSRVGFTAPVTLSCANVPANVTCTPSPNPVTPPANGSVTSSVTFAVAANAAPGVFPVQVRGTDGARVRSTDVVLTIPQPDFSLVCTPATLMLPLGGADAVQCVVGSQFGFSSPVTLTCMGPVGVDCAAPPYVVTPPPNGSTASQVLIHVNPMLASPGQYPVNIQATSGTLWQTALVALHILP
jgi:hypothetical protein